MSFIPVDAYYYQLALGILPVCLVIAVFMTFYLGDSYCDLKVREEANLLSSQ